MGILGSLVHNTGHLTERGVKRYLGDNRHSLIQHGGREGKKRDRNTEGPKIEKFMKDFFYFGH